MDKPHLAFNIVPWDGIQVARTAAPVRTLARAGGLGAFGARACSSVSRIGHALTHARLGIRRSELSVEDVAGGLIGERRVEPARGGVAPGLERHCRFPSYRGESVIQE